MFYVPARIGESVVDVLYGKGLVWVVCTSDPGDIEVRVGHSAMVRVHTSMSSDPSQPSHVLAYRCPDGVDGAAEVTVGGVHVCLGARLAPLREVASHGTLLVTTLYHAERPDAALRPIWEWHYRTRHRVQRFLVYDNSGTAKDAIPWSLPYAVSEGVHCAQSAQLVHAALVCHLYAPPRTWLLNVDFDEFLVSVVPLRQIVETLGCTAYDAVGARCMWADADDVAAAVRRGAGLRTSPFTFAWPQRSKYAQRHDSLESIHRGIHAPAPGARVMHMSPDEGRLVHFAYASGSARSEHLLLLPTASDRFFAASVQ